MENDIPRVEALDREQFQKNYLARNVPVVVTGHSAIREASRKWSLDYLASEHAHHRVPVEFYADGNRNRPWVYKNMDLGEYVSLIRRPEERNRYYLAEKPLAEILPNIAGDVSPPSFLKEDEDRPSAVVFAGVDTFTNAHYHATPSEAVLMQIVGRKRVVLCPARHYRFFYPRPWFAVRPDWSSIPFNCDGTRADRPFWMPGDATERYPGLGKAAVMECVLRGGELLFIPQGWFHIVYGIGESISVTYFWGGSWRNAYWRVAMRDALSIFGKRYLSRPLASAAKLAHVQGALIGLGAFLGISDRDHGRRD
jgi:hypothetical protein